MTCKTCKAPVYYSRANKSLYCTNEQNHAPFFKRNEEVESYTDREMDTILEWGEEIVELRNTLKRLKFNKLHELESDYEGSFSDLETQMFDNQSWMRRYYANLQNL